MIDKVKESKGYLKGLATGGAIGGIIALLFAPKTGKELRKNIGEKKDDLLAGTNRIIENAKDKASVVISDTQEKAGQLIESGKKKLESASEISGDILSEGKNKLESITDKAKDVISHGKEELTSGVSKIIDATKSAPQAIQDQSNSKKDTSAGYKNTYNDDRTKIKK